MYVKFTSIQDAGTCFVFLKVPRNYDVLGGASENTRRQYQVIFSVMNKFTAVDIFEFRVEVKKRR